MQYTAQNMEVRRVSQVSRLPSSGRGHRGKGECCPPVGHASSPGPFPGSHYRGKHSGGGPSTGLDHGGDNTFPGPAAFLWDFEAVNDQEYLNPDGGRPCGTEETGVFCCQASMKVIWRTGLDNVESLKQ